MSSTHNDANLAAILESLGPLPAEARTLVAAQIVMEQQREFAGADRDFRLVVGDLIEQDKFYAIHNDDLKLLNECAVVAGALYAGLANPLAVIGGLVLMLYRFRKMRIAITAQEALALDRVSAAGPQGIDEDVLIEFLGHDLGGKANVPRILKALTGARRSDGTAAALIELADGKYYAVDV